MDPDGVADLGTDHRARHRAVEGPDLLHVALGNRGELLLHDHLDVDQVATIGCAAGDQREAVSFASFRSSRITQLVGRGVGIGLDGGRFVAAVVLTLVGVRTGGCVGADDALHACLGVAGDRAEVPNALSGHLEVELDGLARSSDDRLAVVELDVVLDRAVVDQHTGVRAGGGHEVSGSEGELGGDELDLVARADVGAIAGRGARRAVSSGLFGT